MSMTEKLADRQELQARRAADMKAKYVAQQGLGYQQAMQDLGIDPRWVAQQNAYIPPVNTNPYGIANVPGQEIPGYEIPSSGSTNQIMYKRPVQQAPAQQGLGWSQAMGNGYIQ